MPMFVLSFLALQFLSLPTKPPVVTQARVTIDTERVLEVNGQDEVPDGLFGVTAYNGSNFSTNKSYLPILKNSGIRWVGMPGVMRQMMPARRPQDFPNNFVGWSQSSEARRMLQQGTGVNFAKALPEWRKLGVTPMVYLLGYPSWLAGPVRDLPTNNREAAVVLAEYVALLRQVDPKLTWFHLGNEPNARWFKAKKYGQDYGELFRTVAPAIRTRNSGIKIGGPVLTWPPAWPPGQTQQRDWYTWRSWTMPFIEKAGEELDFFDFHLYRLQEPQAALEEVQAVTNAMWLESGKKKPVIISEYGHYLKNKSDIENPAILWQKRVEPWQNLIMAFLEYQPDKIVSLQIHDLYAQAGGNFRFIKGQDSNDQFDFYRMFQTWRYFSGKRLTAKSSSTDIHAFASLKQGEIVVVLVNTSNKPQKTNLDVVGLNQSGNEAPLETSQDSIWLRQIGPATNIQNDRLSKAFKVQWEHNVMSPLTPEITLKPKETRSIRIFLPTVLNPSKLLKTREFYGDKVHVPFQDGVGEELEFKVAAPIQELQGVINPRLRIGMLAGRSGDKVLLSINNESQVIKSNWFQEIPLKHLSTSSQITVRLKLLKRGLPEKRPTLLRVSSVSLLLDREIE